MNRILSRNMMSNAEYWEKNIEGFSGFYDKKSEENINGNSLVTYFYKKIIFPIEKKYMLERYNYVINYINNNVFAGMKCADIGLVVVFLQKK